MKRRLLTVMLLIGAGFLYVSRAEACIDSNCQPCPVGFSVTKKCCKEADKGDCVIIGDKIEDCGKGDWKDYPHSATVATTDYCCEDETENSCRGGGGVAHYCGEGEYAAYPYSPVKKCCKDATENDCVVIRAKGYCGKYQLEEYPVWSADCCNKLLKKCTGSVKDCPRCI